MHIKGHIRRLLSTSTTSQRTSGRRSDVSEDSSVSYDRSSGSFVQRVTTSLHSRSWRRRRSASEGAAHEASFDDSSIFPEEASIQQPTPPKHIAQLPSTVSRSTFVEPKPSSSMNPSPNKDVSTLQDTTALEVIRKRGDLITKSGEEGLLTWGEDGPSPQERQKSQDLVAAWLDISREPTAPPLVEIPEDVEEAEVAPIRTPLRMLDSISEDEVPEFAGSTISTAPSTPMIPQISRSRSRSPPLRRRSLDGPEEYHMRGLDTIQEGDVAVRPSRRSLDSIKRPLGLEVIPEVEAIGSTSPRRRTGGMLKTLGLQRSESEPVLAYNRQSSNRKNLAPPPLLSISTKMPVVKEVPAVMPRSPSLPVFQRRSKSSPGPFSGLPPPPTLRKPLNVMKHTRGSIALQTSIIEDDESRRLSEVAFMI